MSVYTRSSDDEEKAVIESSRTGVIKAKAMAAGLQRSYQAAG